MKSEQIELEFDGEMTDAISNGEDIKPLMRMRRILIQLLASHPADQTDRLEAAENLIVALMDYRDNGMKPSVQKALEDAESAWKKIKEARTASVLAMISVFRGEKLVARVRAASEEAAIERFAKHEGIPKSELVARPMKDEEGIRGISNRANNV